MGRKFEAKPSGTKSEKASVSESVPQINTHKSNHQIVCMAFQRNVPRSLSLYSFLSLNLKIRLTGHTWRLAFLSCKKCALLDGFFSLKSLKGVRGAVGTKLSSNTASRSFKK